MKDYTVSNEVFTSIMGEVNVSDEVVASNTATQGGEDGWGCDSTIGLAEGKNYLVVLTGWRKFDSDFLKKNKAAVNMPNNLEVVAREVKVSKGSVMELVSGVFPAVIGGRALCSAGVCSAQAKSDACKERALFVVSYKLVPVEGQERPKRVYSARRIGQDEIKVEV